VHSRYARRHPNMTSGLTGVVLVIGDHHRGNTLGLALHLAVVPS
jgi:hypothetical protein